MGTYLLACFFHNYFWFFVQTHIFWFLFTAVSGRSDQASIFCDELLLPTPWIRDLVKDLVLQIFSYLLISAGNVVGNNILEVLWKSLVICFDLPFLFYKSRVSDFFCCFLISLFIYPAERTTGSHEPLWVFLNGLLMICDLFFFSAKQGRWKAARFIKELGLKCFGSCALELQQQCISEISWEVLCCFYSLQVKPL